MAKDETEGPELSEQDMIYYLFVIHDTNGDGYLDGHELRAAFTDFDEHDHEIEKEEGLIPLDEVTEMVDHVLLEDDKNGE
jgi:Ca2+-binding EF-hand superfamily protein